MVNGSRAIEAFSDGVLAIIITIMVLELKVPHGADLGALGPLLPVFLSYVLSLFYWHLLEQPSSPVTCGPARRWPSSEPICIYSLAVAHSFVTGWMGENISPRGLLPCMAQCYYPPRWRTSSLPASSVSYHSRDSALAKAVGKDFKGKVSVVCYAVAIPLAFVNSWLSLRAVRAGGGHVAHP